MKCTSPGEALRQELAKRHWNQAELAQRTGQSKSTISRVLSDRTPISVKLDLDLHMVLGTPQGYWLQLTNRWVAELRGYPTPLEASSR